MAVRTARGSRSFWGLLSSAHARFLRGVGEVQVSTVLVCSVLPVGGLYYYYCRVWRQKTQIQLPHTVRDHHVHRTTCTTYTAYNTT